MLVPGKRFCKRPSSTGATVLLLFALQIVPVALVLTARADEANTASQSDGKPSKSLHEAAADGDIEQVKLLISKRVDINSKDNRGRTALHRAAEKSHTDVVKLVIDRGADVNAKNRRQVSPLQSAAMHPDNQKTVELLISKGADVNARNEKGETPE
jgi:ankyrin repeat protein